MSERERLAAWLRRRGIFDERVLAAMAAVPRELFVPEIERRRAYADRALPIGHGQTISQPFMVATICALLGLRGEERVPQLAEQARRTLAAAGYERVEVRVGDGTLGVPDRAPFQGIAVAAAAPAVPPALYDQLDEGGRLVVPVGSRRDQRLQLIVRGPDGPDVAASVPCRFVPLLGAQGF